MIVHAQYNIKWRCVWCCCAARRRSHGEEQILDPVPNLDLALGPKRPSEVSLTNSGARQRDRWLHLSSFCFIICCRTDMKIGLIGDEDTVRSRYWAG